MKHTYKSPSMHVVELEPMSVIANSGTVTKQMEMDWSESGKGHDASADYEILTKGTRDDDFWE